MSSARETSIPRFPEASAVSTVRLVRLEVDADNDTCPLPSPAESTTPDTGMSDVVDGGGGVCVPPKPAELLVLGLGLGLVAPSPTHNPLRFMTLFSGDPRDPVELVCTPFVSSREIDAVAVLVPADAGPTAVLGIISGAGGRLHCPCPCCFCRALRPLSSPSHCSSPGTGTSC